MLGLAQAVGELCCQAGGADGLHCKGGVPELRAIVALHLHAILSHPQEVVQPGDVPASAAPHLRQISTMLAGGQSP